MASGSVQLLGCVGQVLVRLLQPLVMVLAGVGDVARDNVVERVHRVDEIAPPSKRGRT